MSLMARIYKVKINALLLLAVVQLPVTMYGLLYMFTMEHKLSSLKRIESKIQTYTETQSPVGPSLQPSSNECDEYSFKAIYYRNKAWQILINEEDDQIIRLYLKAAYFDGRDQSKPVIRILALSSHRFNFKSTVISPHLFCSLWSEDAKPIVFQATEYIDLTMWAFHMEGSVQKQYCFVCEVPKVNTGPSNFSHISLSFDECSTATRLPIQYPESGASDKIGVCVPPLYNRMNDKEIRAFIEWVEVCSIFGVDEINLYNVSLRYSSHLEKVISHYLNKGLLKIYEHPHPMLNLQQYDIYEASQLTVRSTTNDCFLKNMFRYSHVLFLDLDEVLVPQPPATNYRELLHHLNSIASSETMKYYQPEAPSIKIKSFNFFLDFPPVNKTISTVPLITTRYLTYSALDTLKHKALVRPDYCMLVHNHDCALPINPSVNMTKVTVPTKYASLHHYRRSCTQGYTAGRKFKQGHRDRMCMEALNHTDANVQMLNYEEILTAKVKHVLQDLKLEFLESY